MKLAIATLVLTALCLPLAAAAEQIEPSDDMYSDPNHGTLPNTETELWCATFSGAGHYERIMIKFDQTELLAIAANGAESAALNLYRFFRCPGHDYTATDIYAGTVDWDEDTWPVPTHLPHETTAVASMTFGPDLGWSAIDITDLVNSWISGERANCGLVIEARTGEKWSKFYSKDHASAVMHPYLEIEPDLSPVPEAGCARLVCAPNPFNPQTRIEFELEQEAAVTLEVYDQRGQMLRELLSGVHAAGAHATTWNGRDEAGRSVAAGSYLIVLTSGQGRLVTKANLIR